MKNNINCNAVLTAIQNELNKQPLTIQNVTMEDNNIVITACLPLPEYLEDTEPIAIYKFPDPHFLTHVNG